LKSLPFFKNYPVALRLASLLTVAVLPACTLPRVLRVAESGRQINVLPTPLTASGETVPFSVEARVPARHLHKNVAYEVLLRYRYDHGLREDSVGRLTFVSGEYVYDDENKKLLVARKQFTLPNTPARNPGQLLARGRVRALKPAGKVLAAKSEAAVARGISQPNRLVVREDTALVLLPETASNEMSGTRTLPFYFDEGKAEIRAYLGTNVQALEDLIDANQQTRRVLIVAGHSPDSVDVKDPQLADKRVKVLKDYYVNRVRTFSYLNKVENITFNTLAYHRRWDLFLSKVQTSALKPAEIDSVVSIINEAKGSYQDKEAQLRQLSSYEYIAEYIYPVLRQGIVAVTYEAAPRYNSEVYLLSKKIIDKQLEADALTPEELRYSATLTPLLAEKQRIYETAAATTGAWQAFHNLAVVLLQRGEKEPTEHVRLAYLRRAATNFTLAAHRNPTAEMFYHAATAYHRAGDNLEALQNYDYAIRQGGDRALLRKIFADRAALELQAGQPEEATRSLRYAGPSYQNSMNQALLYLRQNALPEATAQYQQAQTQRPSSGAPLYGQAIVAARQKDEATAGRLLAQAVKLDRSLAQQAVEDLEFMDIAQSKPFREALK
jgi:hypothetical protein